MFISTSTILCIYVCAFSWINIVQREGSIWNAISKDILSDFLIVYSFIAVWFVGGLTVFHFYLICTNQTTYENFRYRYDKKENPYNKGMIGNLKEVFLSKIQPSMIDFQAFVQEDENIVMELATPNLVGNSISPKGKIDIEMGIKLGEESGLSLPDILRNLDYDEIDDNLKSKEGNGSESPPLFFSIEQESKDTMQNSTDQGVTNAEEKSDEVTSPHETATPIVQV
ncbi:unnamed protein product [Ilex paraguariensis]|uniref:S-acyltransferase n=1 Tax=Ilex paraguariensis TaxID=185542 RepID=A0ABC8RH35_9AQUA